MVGLLFSIEMGLLAVRMVRAEKNSSIFADYSVLVSLPLLHVFGKVGPFCIPDQVMFGIGIEIYFHFSRFI